MHVCTELFLLYPKGGSLKIKSTRETKSTFKITNLEIDKWIISSQNMIFVGGYNKTVTGTSQPVPSFKAQKETVANSKRKLTIEGTLRGCLVGISHCETDWILEDWFPLGYIRYFSSRVFLYFETTTSMQLAGVSTCEWFVIHMVMVFEPWFLHSNKIRS